MLDSFIGPAISIGRMSQIEISAVQLSGLFGGDTDRGRAILGAEILSNVLERLLQKYFVGTERQIRSILTDRYAPLSSFSARTDVAQVLGLISDDTAADLRTIRKVRNAFAHNLEASFDDSSSSDRINSLRVLSAVQLEDRSTNVFKTRTAYSVASYALIALLNKSIELTNSQSRPGTVEVNEIHYSKKSGLRVIVQQTI